MGGKTHETTQEKWARLRHAVVAPLLVSPPEPGAMGAMLEMLSKQRYRHPTEPDRWETFGRSTVVWASSTKRRCRIRRTRMVSKSASGTRWTGACWPCWRTWSR